MTDDQIVFDMSIDDFFIRSGLTTQDQLDCYTFVQGLYPGRSISLASCQGYCSMTMFVGDNTVVQFRPFSYGLDLRITDAARQVYGLFAPETQYIGVVPVSGLLVYSMNRISGISFKDFRLSSTTTPKSTYHRARLCKDFAAFLAKSWHHDNNISIPLGKIGKTLVPRLKSLSTDLPVRFQASARNVLKQLHQIESLPWVLTHGDIVAANIMVEPSSAKMTGLVDWAEAERLPFGVCLYGLEELLGELTPTGFQYRRDAGDLREIFWDELSKSIRNLQENTVLEAVKLARDLGVLLWHGIAFDDGAIDRVVQEGRDVDEIHRLDAFLDVAEHSCLDRGSKI
jgi:hypothetical protein